MSDVSISPRRAETRQRLLDGAVGVFAERGVLAASVEEICDRAGFTRGAFYSNYASKNELVLELFEQDRVRIRETMDTLARSGLVEAAAQHPENLNTYIEAAVRATVPQRRLDREWVMAFAEMRLYAAREPEIRQKYLEYHERSQAELLRRILAIADVSGWEFTMPAQSVVEVLDNMFESAMLQSLLVDPTGDDDTRAQQALGPFIDVMTAIIRPAP